MGQPKGPESSSMDSKGLDPATLSNFDQGLFRFVLGDESPYRGAPSIAAPSIAAPILTPANPCASEPPLVNPQAGSTTTPLPGHIQMSGLDLRASPRIGFSGPIIDAILDQLVPAAWEPENKLRTPSALATESERQPKSPKQPTLAIEAMDQPIADDWVDLAGMNHDVRAAHLTGSEMVAALFAIFLATFAALAMSGLVSMPALFK